MIGWIGLGNMGLPMAVQIMNKSKESLLGYDISEAAVERFAASGGVPAKSAAEIFSKCDLVFLSMPSNGLVRTYIEEGLSHMNNGSVIADTSSITRETVSDLEELAKGKGIGLIDCPVSGGVHGAEAGTLSTMCGGNPRDLQKAVPYIKMYSGKVTYMGEYGSGYTAKLINNMIVGVEITLIAEAFALAEKEGIELPVLMEAIEDGGAGSQVLTIKGRKMIEDDHSVSSTVKIHLKDQKNCMEMAKKLDASIPLLTVSTRILEKMDADGRGDADAADVISYYKTGGVENGCL